MLVQYNESDAHNFKVNLKMGSILKTLLGKMSQEPQFTYFDTVLLNFQEIFHNVNKMSLHKDIHLNIVLNKEKLEPYKYPIIEEVLIKFFLNYVYGEF